MAAQAAAALEALTHAADPAPPRLGYLVSIRNATFTAAHLPDRPLRVIVRPAGGAGPLAIYEFTIEQNATPLASGTLSIYVL